MKIGLAFVSIQRRSDTLIQSRFDTSLFNRVVNSSTYLA